MPSRRSARNEPQQQGLAADSRGQHMIYAFFSSLFVRGRSLPSRFVARGFPTNESFSAACQETGTAIALARVDSTGDEHARP